MIAPAAEIGGLGELEIPIAPPLPDRLAAELQESADFLRGPPFVGFGRIVRRGLGAALSVWGRGGGAAGFRAVGLFATGGTARVRSGGIVALTRPTPLALDADGAPAAPNKSLWRGSTCATLVRERNAGRVASIAALIAILFRHHAAQN